MADQSIHILVAEDEPAIHYAIGCMLKRMGHRVSVAGNGIVARNRLLDASQAATPVDLLLLDLQMPGLSGEQLFNELVQREDCPPILIITGSIETLESKRFDDPHCVGMLCKPFTRDVLQVAIAGAAERIAARRAGQAPDDRPKEKDA
jgi:CheY-like chemotaxis protein